MRASRVHIHGTALERDVGGRVHAGGTRGVQPEMHAARERHGQRAGGGRDRRTRHHRTAGREWRGRARGLRRCDDRCARPYRCRRADRTPDRQRDDDGSRRGEQHGDREPAAPRLHCGGRRTHRATRRRPRCAHVRAVRGGDRAARAGQSHETGHLVVHFAGAACTRLSSVVMVVLPRACESRRETPPGRASAWTRPPSPWTPAVQRSRPPRDPRCPSR